MMPKVISFYRLVLIFLITRKEQPEVEEITKTIIFFKKWKVLSQNWFMRWLRDSEAWNVKDGEEKSTWAMFNVPVQPLSFADEKSGWLSGLPRMPHLASRPTRSRTQTSCLLGWDKTSEGSRRQIQVHLQSFAPNKALHPPGSRECA